MKDTIDLLLKLGLAIVIAILLAMFIRIGLELIAPLFGWR